jgi:ATP-dependent DNA ligase
MKKKNWTAARGPAKPYSRRCLNREEFVVAGWTDPEGSRPWLGALLLACYDPDGRLIYAGRAGTGIDYAELERLWHRLQPLATSKMTPPRDSRFGSPLTLSRVHWVRAELAKVKYLTWTDDNLLRQVVYEGLREDKPAARARWPHVTVRHSPLSSLAMRPEMKSLEGLKKWVMVPNISD